MHPIDDPDDTRGGPLRDDVARASVGQRRAAVRDIARGARPRPGLTRIRIGAAAAVVLVLVVLGIAAVGAALRSAGGTGASTIPLATRAAVETPGATDTGAVGEIYVHVLGAVAAPGLYTLSPDARVVDAIAAAGGFTQEADAASVNLARTVTDGEQIVVTEPGQAPPAGGAAPGAGGGAAPATGPLDLNSATAEQLETLPRIGPALAERIVAWRTDNGPFRLVDELLEVPGIGDAILAGLDGLVTT